MARSALLEGIGPLVVDKFLRINHDADACCNTALACLLAAANSLTRTLILSSWLAIAPEAFFQVATVLAQILNSIREIRIVWLAG